MTGTRALVAGLHLRWDGVWQRPHHLLSRFAQRVPVIVVEEPFWGDDERDEVRDFGGVTVVRPIRNARPAESLVDDSAIATVRALLGTAAPAWLWLYQPMMLELADAFPRATLAYDCMDDLAAFAFAPDSMARREEELLRRADVVFCGGRTLYEHRKHAGANVHLAPSGVEYEHFASARGMEPHRVAAELPPPRYGYLGVIDERVDIELIDALANAPERPNVLMVGPLAKIDPAILPRKPNVHFTGGLPYAALPSILAGLDVALMPFALNASTRSISPTKTLEYLAAGVPVVSTPIPDVVAGFSDVVTIAEGDAFVRACRFATTMPDQDRLERGRDLARTRGWDAIAAGMWSRIA